MADDPYTVLGVARSSSDKEIRTTYRKLAKEKHPDLNPGDKAAETFKKISAAYAVLGDAKKRAAFDRGEIDGHGAPRGFQGAQPGRGGGPFGQQRGWPPGQGDAGFGDIFSDLFGGRGGAPGMGAGRGGAAYAMKGQDVRYTLEVDFIEAVKGAKKRVTLPQGGALDLSVPAGVTDSQTLRLKGKGAAGMRGGTAGDALIEIKVRAHRQFKRSGDDIHIDLPITIDEAILGAKVEVPTVDGRVHLTVPRGTSSGTVLRLKGKGVLNAKTRKTGDQLVTLRIVMPDDIDAGLADFMEEWRKENSYDPGRKG